MSFPGESARLDVARRCREVALCRLSQGAIILSTQLVCVCSVSNLAAAAADVNTGKPTTFYGRSTDLHQVLQFVIALLHIQ